MNIALVALGGAFGSAARYGAARWMVTHVGANAALPWGTLLVNVLGSFLIGLGVNWLPRDQSMRLLLITGFLGGFTTFSAFSIETVGLLRSPNSLNGFVYIAASVVMSLGAAYLGTQVKAHG